MLFITRVAHLDLKPDFIVLDKDYNLKIIDFGYANAFHSETDSLILFLDKKINFETDLYNAPEYWNLNKSPIHGDKFDIYNCGWILFLMMFQIHCVHKSAKVDDQIYGSVISGDWEKFWDKIMSDYKTIVSPDAKIFEDTELKELIQMLLQPDPEKRASIEKIKKSKWYNRGIDTSEEIKETIINSQKKISLDYISSKKKKRGTLGPSKTFIGPRMPQNYLNSRTAKGYVGIPSASPLEMLIQASTHEVFHSFVSACIKSSHKFRLSDDEYEAFITKTVEKCEVIVRFAFFTMDGDECFVTPTRVQGDFLEYIYVVNEIKQILVKNSDSETD